MLLKIILIQENGSVSSSLASTVSPVVGKVYITHELPDIELD